MEQLVLTSTDKEERYKEIIPQIETIISGEEDLIANLANVAAILKEAFDFFWVGFYLVKSIQKSDGTASASVKEFEEELVLGPFQGPLACTRIKYGRGVCGSAWREARTLVVPDVDKFPGHIACSSLSRSEIVVPVFKGKNSEVSDGSANGVAAVLDIDSKELSTFNDVDAKYLEELSSMITSLLFK